ncbi:hypothetical protein Ddc_15483 [Ditylenchus destructor]|nr:hypothetical protein Ddc_15483 [Ditylenchus destructor]
MEGRNRQISLSSETIADILRHFSRKKLSQELCLVNQNIWQIATSRHLVPNLHLINELHIDTQIKRVHYSCDDIQEYVDNFNPETNIGYGNLIKIKSVKNFEWYRFPVSYLVKNMPTPKPFVRFGKVRIEECEDETLVEFLRNANGSFIGCDLTIDYHLNSLNNDVPKNLTYLLANAFIRPAQISIDVNCGSGLHQILRVLYCNKLEFCTRWNFVYTYEFHSALLDWLQNNGCEKKRMIEAESKILVLQRYPKKMILSMVEHLRQVFESDSSPAPEFLITFVCTATPNLDGEQLNFPWSKIQTGEKLSFFKGKDTGDEFIYRLWRRKETNKSADRMMEWQYKNTNIYKTFNSPMHFSRCRERSRETCQRSIIKSIINLFCILVCFSWSKLSKALAVLSYVL